MTLSSMRVSVYLLTACDIAVSSCPAICLGRNAPALLSAVVKTVMVVRMACLSCCSAQTGICAECDVKVRHNMICCNRGAVAFPMPGLNFLPVIVSNSVCRCHRAVHISYRLLPEVILGRGLDIQRDCVAVYCF